LGVGRPIHGAHAALAELGRDAVMGDCRAGHRASLSRNGPKLNSRCTRGGPGFGGGEARSARMRPSGATSNIGTGPRVASRRVASVPISSMYSRGGWQDMEPFCTIQSTRSMLCDVEKMIGPLADHTGLLPPANTTAFAL